MIAWLLIGVGLAVALLVLLNWWANAEVKTAKSSLFWAIIGVCTVLSILLLVTGRGLFAIVPIGIAVWRMFGQAKTVKDFVERAGRSRKQGDMTRQEALEALGLKDGASADEIKAAYKRLMARCHPDTGGSDWMAAKLNEAKRVLLGE